MTIQKCITQLHKRSKNDKPADSIITEDTRLLIIERERLKKLTKRIFAQRKTLRKLYQKIDKKIKSNLKQFRIKTILRELENSVSSKRAIKKLDNSKK